LPLESLFSNYPAGVPFSERSLGKSLVRELISSQVHEFANT
jgi:hypothetical protein